MSYATWQEKYLNAEKRSKTPNINYVNFYDAAKIRTVEEFKNMAQRLKPIAEKYSGRESLWSGKILLRSDCYPHKAWGCDIVLLPNATEYIVLHELIHSCSISYFGEMVFNDNALAEELATHYLGQEIAAKEGIPVIWTDYNEGVELLRDFRKILGVKETDLSFAAELIKNLRKTDGTF